MQSSPDPTCVQQGGKTQHYVGSASVVDERAFLRDCFKRCVKNPEKT